MRLFPHEIRRPGGKFMLAKLGRRRESLRGSKYICYDRYKTVIASRKWFRLKEGHEALLKHAYLR